MNPEEKASVSNTINKIDFSTWKIDQHVCENYEFAAVGFCINNSFSCAFKNGEKLLYLAPADESFQQFITFLKGFFDKTKPAVVQDGSEGG